MIDLNAKGWLVVLNEQWPDATLPIRKENFCQKKSRVIAKKKIKYHFRFSDLINENFQSAIGGAQRIGNLRREVDIKGFSMQNS